MGVPKFFRWLSERYPKILDRHGSWPDPDLAAQHGRTLPAVQPLPPDPLSTCGLSPQIDRLYIDFNGILHGCSHNNNEDTNDDDAEQAGTDTVASISHDEIFRNVCFYLDRLVQNVSPPKDLLYIAIDGVAPRAKLNQQRARRFRSGQEGAIEQTVYDAHLQALQKEQQAQKEQQDWNQAHGSNNNNTTTTGNIQEVEPGRFTGKFVTHGGAATDTSTTFTTDTNHSSSSNTSSSPSSTASSTPADQPLFHSNDITPGTPFFDHCTQHLQHFIQKQVATHPAWQHLTVIFSGPNTPGEGEHKILQFMREQQQLPDYNPNLRHCIMGQDGDLIMLGLATHEPNLVLLREQVLFGKRQQQQQAANTNSSLDTYLYNANFEWLHMNVLRDYLAYEFETVDSQFDLEHTIDDFVFLTFLVGNDFLPHMPALDIADEAFDLIFYTYRSMRKKWLRQHKKKSDLKPYLTDSGNIISGRRLEEFLSALGSHEVSYYSYKKDSEDADQARKFESKHGMEITPSDEILQSKEASDRANFRQMIHSSLENEEQPAGFVPVLTSLPTDDDDDEEAQKNILARMGDILQYSVNQDAEIDDQDLKGRYYYDKFGFSPFDAEKHVALRKAYVEGLVWNLKYYYEGCVSWEWYYPYHYGPMLSDLVGLDEILEEVSFEGKMGEPLKPFEQLMACMPPSHADLLPEPYRPFMTDPESPVAEFYPRSFTVDMNGKRWPWEAVVLLPFIDSKRLLSAARSVDPTSLTEDERKRNELGDATIFVHDPSVSRTLPGVGEGELFATIENCTTAPQPFESSPWYFVQGDKRSPLFRPEILPGTETPLSGLPTLRDNLVTGIWRRSLRINVHGVKSRYKTSCLEMENAMPEIIPVDVLAEQLVGTTVYMNYPHMIEAFVTAVSDADYVVRGGSPIRPWTAKEHSNREQRVRRIVSHYVFGERMTGTGGLSVGGEESMEEMNTLLHVRPMSGLKTLEDGTVVKTFAKFEVEVPLFVTSWAPYKEDERLKCPARLEKNPYSAAKVVLTETNRKLNDDEEKMPYIRNSFQYSMRRPARSRMSARGVHSLASFHEAQNMSSSNTPYELARIRRLLPSTQKSHFSTHAPPRNFLLKSKLGAKKTMLQTSAFRLPRGRAIAVGVIAALSYLPGASCADFYSSTGLGIHSRTGSHNGLHGIFGTDALDSQDMREDSSPFEVSSRAPPLEFAHGTTTLSFVFQGGIIAAVDSRASLGSFVGSKTVQKVLPVNTHMLGTMAGGAADCSFWIRQLSSEAALHEITNAGRRMSVARASRVLSNYLYANRGLGLSVGTMLMGFDDDSDSDEVEGSPPRIFYIDNTGLRIEGDLFSVGSGSTFALGILDTERRLDMTVGEAVALGIKAIRHATFRDAYSGGFINVFLITREGGWKRVYSEDLARRGRNDIDIDKRHQCESGEAGTA